MPCPPLPPAAQPPDAASCGPADLVGPPGGVVLTQEEVTSEELDVDVRLARALKVGGGGQVQMRAQHGGAS